MRLSGLSLAVILLSVSVAFAQHGGGGGGSSGGGSSGGGSSGGGSHGGGGGGSSSSGGSGGHSSGGGGGHSSSSGTHSSGSHSSGGKGSNTSVTRPGTRGPDAAHPIREPNGALQAKAAPEKRTFFSFVRHPFRRPQPKAVVVARRPVCLKGPCRVCPPGKLGRGCGVLPTSVRHECQYPLVWNSGICTSPTPIIDTCDALLAEMQRQEQRMQAAQAAERSACSQGVSQACSDATTTRQNEESRYQSALDGYRRCQMGGAVGYRFPGDLRRPGTWVSNDPFRLELTY